MNNVLRIGIVTSEFHGLFKNGGIGTANTGLAQALAEAGHDVVVAYVDPGGWPVVAKTHAFLASQERWRDKGVILDVIPRCGRLAANVEDLGWSYSTLSYLRARRFDVVFFNECGGQAYYSTLAKRAGAFLDAPRMIVVTHGSSEWARELNAQLPGGYRSAGLSFIERRSVELADLAISPSRYLLNWMREREWRLPQAVDVLQNIVPAPAAECAEAPQLIDELVFFGRLETRKGVEIFCDAVEALDREGRLGGRGITFLGKFSRIGCIHSGVFLLERSKNWSVAPRFVADLNQAEAIDYLQRPGVLAIIPSLAENSPCVVVECILAGAPFLASDSGGTPELVAEADRALCLVPPTAEAFAARLREIFESGHARARMAIPQAETRARWRELVVRGADAPSSPTAPRPRVSVCVCLQAGEDIEPATLASIRAQDGVEVETLVVVYGAAEDRGPETVGGETRLALRSAHRSAARNAAAAAANGEWLMFAPANGWMLEPDALAILSHAATRLGVEAISALTYSHGRPKPLREWDGEIATLPLGPSKEFAAFENCLGDEIFLMSARAFAEIGGFESTESPEVDNRLLLTRALLSGIKIDLVPAPLGWVRSPPGGRSLGVSDMRRILALYAARPVAEFAHVFESVLSQGQHQLRARAQAWLAPLDETTRELAMKLTLDFPSGEAASFPTFLAYALARNRLNEALDFARRHDPQALLPIAEAAVTAAAKHAAPRWLNTSAWERTTTISLTAELSERLRLVQAPRGVELARDGRCVAAHRLAPGLIVAKAPLALPSGAMRVEAWLDFAGAPQSEFALAAVLPGARIPLDALETNASADASFSGWRQGAHVTLGSLPAAPGACDLFLLTRTPATAGSEAWAAWRRIEAQVEISALATPSAVVEAEARYLIPMHVLQTAEVLTDASDFSHAVFTPGVFTQHHPLPGRPAVVRIRGALPAGATGIAAAFSVENERAHPIAFAFWLRAANSPAEDEAGLADSPAASGWTLCPKPFEVGAAEARLPAPAPEAMDLYLVTKVVGFDDIFWCHAYWREIVVLERLRR